MQQITISGTLLEDAVVCTDKNQRSFTRFIVSCGEEDQNGRMQFTHYNCTCYLPICNNLKKGDLVLISGKFSAKCVPDENGGMPKLRLNVMVYQLSGGYRQKE